jgi:hypothetical protein
MEGKLMTATDQPDAPDLKAAARTQFWARVDQAAARAGLSIQTLDQRVLAGMNRGLYAAVAEVLREVADESEMIQQGKEIGEFMPTAETWMRHRADQFEGAKQ